MKKDVASAGKKNMCSCRELLRLRDWRPRPLQLRCVTRVRLRGAGAAGKRWYSGAGAVLGALLPSAMSGLDGGLGADLAAWRSVELGVVHELVVVLGGLELGQAYTLPDRSQITVKGDCHHTLNVQTLNW